MMRSLWSGVSGLKTHQLEMDVIGNNISNVNTTAFKAQTTGFKDVLYQTVRQGTGAGQNLASTNVSQVGLGTRMGSIYTSITTQGSAITTNNVFDLMITGDSFFVVSKDMTSQERFFTRDGAFTIDSAGNLVTQNDGYVMNYIQGVGTQGSQGKYTIISDETKTIDGTPTGEAYLKGNINRDDPTLEEGKMVFLEIFGADGNTYTLKLKTTDNADTEDNTYRISIDSILDSEGHKVNNSYEKESIELVYNKHDGTLDHIVPQTYYTFGQTGTTVEDGKVVETKFAYSGTIGTVSNSKTVTGTDGEQYKLDFTINWNDLEDSDLTFALNKATKLTGTDAGKTYEFDDMEAFLDYDDETGTLLTINGETTDSFKFDFDGKNISIGELSFDFSDSSKVVSLDKSFTFHFGGDAAGKLGDSLLVDFANTTNYASTNGGTSSTIYAYRGNVEGLNKGYAKGDMTGVSITDNGEVWAKYSNGQDIMLMQIGVAQFSNPMGLEKVGDNLYKETPNSGEAKYYDITKIGGYISSGVLEGSNVNLAKEFTDMITTQRGFQANSKVITTSDEMLQILKGLKT